LFGQLKKHDVSEQWGPVSASADRCRAEVIKGFEEELSGQINSWSWTAAAKSRKTPMSSYGDFSQAAAHDDRPSFSGFDSRLLPLMAR
jgi:hypothetical protein